MIRWALKLSEFNIEWEHRSGVQNVVANVLSRNTVGNMDGSQISCAALRALALNSREQLIREQKENPELGHISSGVKEENIWAPCKVRFWAPTLNFTKSRHLRQSGFGPLRTLPPLRDAGVAGCPYPAFRPERYRFLLIITDHFTKWSELIPLQKASAQAIANALFENYISRYGAAISLISDNGPQFISGVFEHLSHRLDIKHIKTVTYRPQVNFTERVNRIVVQMIACFVEENPDNWDRFLHEFAFELRTSVNETTGKTPAELFVGRKIITLFSKLINVPEGAEYVGGNIEKLFDEARQNMRKQHKTWENTIIGKGERLTSKQCKPPTEESRQGTRVQYDRARETRTTPSKGNSAAERRPVLSRQATAVRPCPYYLRSRLKKPGGIPEEQRSTGIDSLPQNNLRRRSISMEALDGDPVDRSE
ncbi:retrovirus-related Pol polyprotein from transposon 17.6 [Trichonephila clavipes]|nr:retrovirus-related Pol polyprotein from transposon 17.6 [Trichonephila clavipes]